MTNSRFVPLTGSGRPGIASARAVSPRATLTGLLFGSPNVTISAVSAFSAGSTPAVSSFAGVPPRMIFTACHSVSGNETIWTLTGFFSTGRLPMVTVTWCTDLAEALAACPCDFTQAFAAYPCDFTDAFAAHPCDFTEAFAAYPCGCVISSSSIAPGIPLAQLSFRIDPPTDATDPSTV